MPLKVIMPKALAFTPERMNRAIQNGLDAAAVGARADFEATTQTWRTAVTFTIEDIGTFGRRVSTANTIYGYVNDGTKPHTIVAKPGKSLRFGTPYDAKTRPRVLGSSHGGSGSDIVVTKRVRHPGTQPRDFAQTIAKKWDKELARVLQRAIDAEL